MKTFNTFKEFYPYYLKEHSSKLNRSLHYIGTTGVIFIFIYALFYGSIYFVAMPFIGYGFAWVGHFVVEKNRPATFKYPIYSLRGDFTMYFDWLLGRLGSKIQKRER